MSISPTQTLDELGERTLQLAVVARALDDRSDRATRALEHAAREVSAAVTQLAAVGDQIGRDATDAVARDASAQVREAVAAGFVEADAALNAYALRVRELERRLLDSEAELVRGHRRWLVVAPALLIVGCVLAVAGTAGWVASARSDVARHQAEAATLQALARSDVVRCGDALCVRLAPGHGQGDGYRRVAARATGP